MPEVPSPRANTIPETKEVTSAFIINLPIDD
jgi:hypothetical protein